MTRHMLIIIEGTEVLFYFVASIDVNVTIILFICRVKGAHMISRETDAVEVHG